MKKQKGFTLIELLAVIVILAIIALIATPMIMDVIDKAKKGAVEQSALGYLDGIEKFSMYGILDNTGLSTGVYTVKEIEEKPIEYKGETPEEGWIAIDSKGAVVAAYLKFKSYSSKWVGYTVKASAKANLDASVYTLSADDAAKKPSERDYSELETKMKQKLESSNTPTNPDSGTETTE